jgi:hypothetical protein
MKTLNLIPLVLILSSSVIFADESHQIFVYRECVEISAADCQVWPYGTGQISLDKKPAMTILSTDIEEISVGPDQYQHNELHINLNKKAGEEFANATESSKGARC